MAISKWTMDEIQRKAENGIKMDAPTPEKQKAYDDFQNFYKNETVKKAQSGTALQRPNEWKNSIYQQNSPQASISPVGNPVVTQQPSFTPYNPSVNKVNPQSFDSATKNAFVQTNNNDPNNVTQSYNFGNTSFNQDQMNEIAYYDDLKSNLLKQRQDLTMQEVNKGYGIGEDFSKSALAPLQKQYYEIEDYMLKKFGQFDGRGGTGNDYSFYGLDRASLGMNSADENGFRIHDTAEEWDMQKQLAEKGYSTQEAYNMVRGIDPKSVYSPTNQFKNDTVDLSAIQKLLELLPNVAKNTPGNTPISNKSNGTVNERQKALAERIRAYLGM